MQITKSGFYKISRITGDEINVSSDLTVVIFDDGNFSGKIEISDNTNVQYYGYDEQNSNKVKFIQKGSNGILLCNYLILSCDNKITKEIYSLVTGSNNKTNINIINFVLSGNIDLNGVLHIAQNTKVNVARLDETNIYIGEGIISGIPSLLVETEDVEAGHSMKVEKISSKKLFYLQSRGMNTVDAENLMLNAYINAMFGGLENVEEKLFLDLKKHIFGKIGIFAEK